MEQSPCGIAFLAMYHLLDSIYWSNPDDTLSVVLSDTCPYTFKDGMSADPAAWEDFSEYYKEATGAYNSEIEVGYNTALRFLCVYEEEWDFPIPRAIEAFTIEKYREYYCKQE